MVLLFIGLKEQQVDLKTRRATRRITLTLMYIHT